MNRTKVGQKPESKEDVIKGKDGASGGENISPSLEEQISRRAYQLYEQRGQEHGHADEDWLKAEREILEGVPPAETSDKSS
ncbi:MAG: DUF2934 domain-containing protein [Candidatus Acidiferrum sp.]